MRSPPLFRLELVELAPHELHLGAYGLSGSDNMGECYFSPDGDSMVKIYSDPELLALAWLEQHGARARDVRPRPRRAPAPATCARARDVRPQSARNRGLCLN